MMPCGKRPYFAGYAEQVCDKVIKVRPCSENQGRLVLFGEGIGLCARGG